MESGSTSDKDDAMMIENAASCSDSARTEIDQQGSRHAAQQNLVLQHTYRKLCAVDNTSRPAAHDQAGLGFAPHSHCCLKAVNHKHTLLFPLSPSPLRCALCFGV